MMERLVIGCGLGLLTWGGIYVGWAWMRKAGEVEAYRRLSRTRRYL